MEQVFTCNSSQSECSQSDCSHGDCSGPTVHMAVVQGDTSFSDCWHMLRLITLRLFNCTLCTDCSPVTVHTVSVHVGLHTATVHVWLFILFMHTQSPAETDMRIILRSDVYSCLLWHALCPLHNLMKGALLLINWMIEIGGMIGS